MTIIKSQAAALRKRIKRYANAKIDDSWKGGGDPNDIPEIERELRVAKQNLDNYINRLTQGTPEALRMGDKK